MPAVIRMIKGKIQVFLKAYKNSGFRPTLSHLVNKIVLNFVKSEKMEIEAKHSI